MDTSLAAARIVRFLEQEPVVWLSTVRADGDPHLVPIWFWWDGEALLVFSKPDSVKVRNLRANRSVMLALGDADDDFDIGLLHGRAELLEQPTRAVLPAAHLAKYATRLARIGVDADEYAATYSQVIRIVPDDYLGWHGRNMPHSARLPGAPRASIGEPRRQGTFASAGEPLAEQPSGRRARPPREPARRGPSLRDRLGEPLRGWRGLGEGLRPSLLPRGGL